MLKIIATVTILTLPMISIANEFEITIFDLALDDVQIEKVSNEYELKYITNFLRNLNDDSIEFKVKKLNSNTVDAIVRGGEGGTD